MFSFVRIYIIQCHDDKIYLLTMLSYLTLRCPALQKFTLPNLTLPYIELPCLA